MNSVSTISDANSLNSGLPRPSRNIKSGIRPAPGARAHDGNRSACARFPGRGSRGDRTTHQRGAKPVCENGFDFSRRRPDDRSSVTTVPSISIDNIDVTNGKPFTQNQRRQEPMHSVEVGNVASKRLQPAGGIAGIVVSNLARRRFARTIAWLVNGRALYVPGGQSNVCLRSKGEQRRQIARIVLSIAVQSGHEGRVRRTHPRKDGSALTAALVMNQVTQRLVLLR